MRVVVTGGAGFVGSHVAAHLAGRGFRVVAVDSLERASAVKRLEEAGVPLWWATSATWTCPRQTPWFTPQLT